MRPAIRLRVAHLWGGGPPGTKRPYVRYIYIYIYNDSEIIVLGLAKARPNYLLDRCRASMGQARKSAEQYD